MSRYSRVVCTLTLRVAVALFIVSLLTPPASAFAASSGRTKLPPVVLFPAFHFTKLLVTVRHQVVAPNCPRSGTFEDWFSNNHPGTTFSQVCRDKLLTLRYDANPAKPMPLRFSNQQGVTVQISDYGMTQSAPFYETLYRTLEAVGYVRNVSIRVAGYDSRLTPDMGGFLQRTKALIEETYRENGDRPVHLIGHSNGPLYAQYLLTHTTRAWRDRYIHGFTPIAGNFPGQGLVYALFFTGLNILDFSFPTTRENAQSSARMYLSSPSTYMSAADPAIFGHREIVVADASTGRSYTPQDYGRLFKDARLPQAEEIADDYIGFVKFADPAHFPSVDVYAERGSGIATVVGMQLHNLSVGQVVGAATVLFKRDGDVNQEDITNTAILAWRAMPCFHFSLTDTPGIDHFSLPANAGVLARLVSDLGRPRSACR
jgi:lecithin-cholesterol acyltransferase